MVDILNRHRAQGGVLVHWFSCFALLTPAERGLVIHIKARRRRLRNCSFEQFRAAATTPGGRAYDHSVVRGAVGGVIAAAAWAAAEPLAQRVFGTTYSDTRLIGRLVTRGPKWASAGLAIHLANGAVFGAAFEALGGRGARKAIVAAELESALLWPGLVVIDRIHPDVTGGRWRPLLTDDRVFVQEVAMHALFGAVLGSIVRSDAAASPAGGG